MHHESFCVLILSNGRPDNIITLKALEFHGYTGDWRIVVDDEDPTVPQYIERWGQDRVIVFSKKGMMAKTDIGDNFPNPPMTVLLARNACFDIAQELGVEHFLELDDDYKQFHFRFWNPEKEALDVVYVDDLDAVFDTMLDFLEDSGADCVALAQGGDYIGGWQGSKWQQRLLRKAMNTLFIRSDATFRFSGRMNEDVITYTMLSTKGHLFFTTMYCHILQQRTQLSAGGMSTEYAALGTYVKTFYAVMMCPSAVKVWVMDATDGHSRIHHQVKWRYCAPRIIPESLRKERAIA